MNFLISYNLYFRIIVIELTQKLILPLVFPNITVCILHSNNEFACILKNLLLLGQFSQNKKTKKKRKKKTKRENIFSLTELPKFFGVHTKKGKFFQVHTKLWPTFYNEILNQMPPTFVLR